MKSQFDHLFFTNRPVRRLFQGGPLEIEKPGPSLEFSLANSDGRQATGSLHYGRVYGEIRRPGIHISSEDSDFDLDLSYCILDEDKKDKDVSPERQFFQELFRRMEDGRDVLIFVHGYSHSFNKLMGTVGRMHRGYVENQNSKIGHLIVFSWPSAGNFSQYGYDRRVARTSAQTLVDFVEHLHKYVNEKFAGPENEERRQEFLHRFNIMAVSMGNYVLEEFVLQWAASHGLKPTFNEVIHMAADVGVDAYAPENALSGMLNVARRVHVYVNRSDVLLKASSQIHRVGRLGGHWGLNSEDKATDSQLEELAERLVYVDATDVAVAAMKKRKMIFSQEELQYNTLHNYMLRVNAVVEDANFVLNHHECAGIARRAGHGLGYRLV